MNKIKINRYKILWLTTGASTIYTVVVLLLLILHVTQSEIITQLLFSAWNVAQILLALVVLVNGLYGLTSLVILLVNWLKKRPVNMMASNLLFVFIGYIFTAAAFVVALFVQASFGLGDFSY